VEINDLQEKVFRVEQQLSAKVDISCEKEADCTQHETIDLKSKLQSKEAKIEKMKYEHLTREAALAEKELLEEEYKKKFDEAKKELSLENDIACMWVLVAKLKRGALDISDLNVDDRTKV